MEQRQDRSSANILLNLCKIFELDLVAEFAQDALEQNHLGTVLPTATMIEILGFRRSLLAKTLLSLLLFSLATFTAFAQNKLYPAWTAGGNYWLPNQPQYNRYDGSRLLIWYPSEGFTADNSFTVYNTATNTVVAHIRLDGLNGSLTSAYLNPAGSAVFYATSSTPQQPINSVNRVYEYQISSNTQTTLSISEGSPIVDLTTSSDGSYLAYVTTDGTTNSSETCIYNLTSNSYTSKFDSVATGSLAFVNQNTDVVLSGPTLYSITGSKLASGGLSGNYPLAVSIDESRVYENNGGTVYAYLAANLTKLWSANEPTVQGVPCTGSYGWNLAVTADDNALLFAQNTGTTWYVAALNAKTGSQLSNYISTPSSGNSLAGYNQFLATNPKTNQILLGPGSPFAGDSPNAEYWTYNSSTGSGAYNGIAFTGGTPGQNVGDVAAVQPVVTLASVGAQTISGITVPTSSVTGTGAKQISIYAQGNGGAVGYLPNEASPSPDGRYYALISNANSLGVYSTTTNSLIASLPSVVGYSPAVQWGTNDLIAVHYLTSENVVSTYTFNGSSISLSATFPNFSWFKLSPDGTEIALFGYGPDNIIQATLCDARNGNLLATINPDSQTWTGISDITFSVNNTLAVQEVVEDTSGNFHNQVRIITLTSKGLTQTGKFSYTLPTSYYPYNTEYNADAEISPDGLSIVMAHPIPSTSADPREQASIKLYSVGSGALIYEWDNQFIPDFGHRATINSSGTFSFSADSKTLYWCSAGLLVAVGSSPYQLNLSANPTSVPGGSSSTATLTISPTPTTAITVNLSSNSTAVSVPATVTIPANQSSVTFNASTSGVAASTPATITATLNNASATTVLTVTPPTAATVSFSPSTVNAGTASTGTIQLNAAAGPGGIAFTLSSSNTTVVSVPTTVTVPAKATSVTFTAKTSEPTQSTSATITAKGGGLTGSGVLNVNYYINLTCTLSASQVQGGSADQLTVALSNPAPTGGLTLTLATSNSALQPRTTYVVPAGQTSASFGIPSVPVSANTTATITVSDPDGPSATAAATVLAPVLQEVMIEDSTVVGGESTFALLIYSGPVPANFSVSCTSSNKVVTIPSTTTVPQGHSVVEIPITTLAVTSATIVTLTIGGQTVDISLLP